MQAPALLNQNLCWRYLSSQAVASQVLWTEMSLTTVFGMGTGGPSPQSAPTLFHQVLPHSTLSFYHAFAPLSMVTRTGFEPMLTA